MNVFQVLTQTEHHVIRLKNYLQWICYKALVVTHMTFLE